MCNIIPYYFVTLVHYYYYYSSVMVSRVVILLGNTKEFFVVQKDTMSNKIWQLSCNESLNRTKGRVCLDLLQSFDNYS
jgi:hypothetical protein